VLQGFKQFLMRGNVIDLAVGIVMGSAFTAIVNGLVEGIITPLIAAIFGQPDISKVGQFTLNGAAFSVGEFLQAILNFLMIGAALYFIIILPINKLQAHQAARRAAEEAQVTSEGTASSETPSSTEIRLEKDIRKAEDREIQLLTEIRHIIKQEIGGHH